MAFSNDSNLDIWLHYSISFTFSICVYCKITLKFVQLISNFMYKRTLNYCFANLIWWSLSIYNHVSKATVWTHVVHKHFIWIRWLLIIEEHKTCWISITVFCICTKIFDEHPIKNMSYIFVIVLIFLYIYFSKNKYALK